MGLITKRERQRARRTCKQKKRLAASFFASVSLSRQGQAGLAGAQEESGRRQQTVPSGSSG
eukprot:1246979-Pyramimonas_sp.AAC.1